MKIKVGGKYVVDVKNSMNGKQIELVFEDCTDTQWTSRGLAFLKRKFPYSTFIVEWKEDHESIKTNSCV